MCQRCIFLPLLPAAAAVRRMGRGGGGVGPEVSPAALHKGGRISQLQPGTATAAPGTGTGTGVGIGEATAPDDGGNPVSAGGARSSIRAYVAAATVPAAVVTSGDWGGQEWQAGHRGSQGREG